MRTDIRQLLPVLALVATVLAGCADTEIQGNVLDEDINSPELMMGVARGVNSEFADLYLASALQYELESPTDGALNDGTAAAEIDRAVGDFRERPQSSLWAQAHEAVWASLFAGRRMLEVLGAEEYAKSPLAARIFVYGGHAERILGETFCELVYNYGKDGGQMLGEAGPYSNATPVPNDSAFKRAIFMFETGLAHAEAAITGAVPTPEGDPLFDPVRLRDAAHAGLAQVYANLGDWTQAVNHARFVPDNFTDVSSMHSEVDGGNDVADFFYAGDDLSIYRTPGALLWPTDPRVALARCGDWRTTNRDNDAAVPPATAFNNLATSCGQTAGEFRSESNRYPLWISRKYADDNADVEVASGAEMRLIEAEAALRVGNLGEFTTQVNRARAARGVAAITQPTAVGALEYPNAQDDGWSILDRERYLEGFLEGRRFWDLRRWNHPFWTGNHILVPRLNGQLAPQGRMRCQPIPQQECTTNGVLNCPVIS